MSMSGKNAEITTPVIDEITRQLSFLYGKKPIVFFVTEDVDFIDKVFLRDNNLFPCLQSADKKTYVRARTLPDERVVNIHSVYRYNTHEYESSYSELQHRTPYHYFYLKNAHMHAAAEGGANASAMRLRDSLMTYVLKHQALPEKDKAKNMLFMSAPVFAGCDGLEPYIEIIDVPVANEADIRMMLMDCFSPRLREKRDPDFEASAAELIRAFKGLNDMQIARVLGALRDSFPTVSIMTPDQVLSGWPSISALIAREIDAQKKQIVKLNSIITFCETKAVGVGGCEGIIGWLCSCAKTVLNPEKYPGSPPPKGVIVFGVPGTGKSLLAAKMAQELKTPLLKLDLGGVFSKYVGESEGQLRRALSLAEAIAPCVLFIDEIEKALPSAGKEVHEVTQRLYGYILSWMDANKKPVFIYTTANNIALLDGALLRRLENVYYSFMPSQRECVEIVLQNMRVRSDDARRPLYQSDVTGSEPLKGMLNELLVMAAENGDFMTGSDINRWLNAAMVRVYANGPLAEPISNRKLKEALEAALPGLKPYGKTNLRSLAHYWLQVKAHEYLCVGDEIIPFADFDLNRSDDESSYFTRSRAHASPYDALLYEAVTSEIDRNDSQTLQEKYFSAK